MTERLHGVEEALDDAGADDARNRARDSMPLLGLEPTSTENTGQNAAADEVSPTSACYAPLLGTIPADAQKCWFPASPIEDYLRTDGDD